MAASTMNDSNRLMWIAGKVKVTGDISRLVVTHDRSTERRNWLRNAITEAERLRMVAIDAGEPAGMVRGLERSIAYAWRTY